MNNKQMNDSLYIAHICSTNDIQTLKEHCENVSKLTQEFADAFDAGDYGKWIGLFHDIGKYSKAWQAYIRNERPDKIDHSTAGAKEAYEKNKNPIGLILAYCISGHHTGLLNGGSRVDSSNAGTLWARLNKEIEDYRCFKENIEEMPKLARPDHLKLVSENEKGIGNYTLAFFIRMLYSCLVDSDYLDTEKFMSSGTVIRDKGENLSVLKERLFNRIRRKGYLTGSSGINLYRSKILNDCILSGRQSNKALYTLTVPTGGGKTIASIAFALEAACARKKDRIIYVIPYCSIIEQTVDIFNDIFGENNVLAVYGQAEYEKEQLRLAAGNWDKPIVITTAVQFFESFYSNRPSTCRKLHNTVNSVIIFDEVQSIPLDNLLPCIKVIKELIINYNSLSVFCTATQPALGRFFDCTFIDRALKPLEPVEICKHTEVIYNALKRVTYIMAGPITDDNLASRLKEYSQALCIVSTRAQAKNLYRLLDSGNKYHLSTNMTPLHRKKVLSEVRGRLQNGEDCILVSTSLIEAGVDVDFPVVFRALTGLDSIIQSGGRCNREGRYDLEESKVVVFIPEEKYKLPSSMELPSKVTELVTKGVQDISDLDVINEYYQYLFNLYSSNDNESFDIADVVERFEKSKNCSFPFKDIFREFHMIRSDTVSIFIPDGSDAAIVIMDKLRKDDILIQSDYQYIGLHSINVYSDSIEKIRSHLEFIDDYNAILIDNYIYDCEVGIEYGE